MHTKTPNGALESRINVIFGICLYLNKAYVQFSLFLKVCLLYHFKYMNAHTWQWIDLSSWPLTNYTSSQSWGLTRLCNARPAPPTLALCTAASLPTTLSWFQEPLLSPCCSESPGMRHEAHSVCELHLVTVWRGGENVQHVLSWRSAKTQSSALFQTRPTLT